MGTEKRNEAPKLRLVQPGGIEAGAPRNLLLNPYVHLAFTKCPGCQSKTKVRKYPLVIHIDPKELLVLNKSCRYCVGCSLLIIDQSDMEALMTEACEERNPDIIGNDYTVMGTIPHALWRQQTKTTVTIEDVLNQIRLFEDEWDLELAFEGA